MSGGGEQQLQQHVLEDVAAQAERDDPFAHLIDDSGAVAGGGTDAGAEHHLYATSRLALTGLPPATVEQLLAFMRQEGVSSAREVELNAAAGTACAVVGDHQLGLAFGLAGKSFLGSPVEVSLATDDGPPPAPAAPPAGAAPPPPMPPAALPPF